MSIQIKIGNLLLGGNVPIVVQSMTNTNTLDVTATIAQIRRMIAAGTEMIRITVPSLQEVESMKEIKKQLRAEKIETPLIADVHFNPKVAEKMAEIVEKVRINPGNYIDKRNFQQLDFTDAQYRESLDKMAKRAKPLFDVCKQHDTAVRLGINHGSLCDRIVSRFGNTPYAMAMSAMEWVDICEYYDFHKVVLSMKSSNVNTMMEATLLLSNLMEERGISYPLHLGVTEAGAGLDGRVKSAVGIGALLLMKVGDTIRVSLTEAPENETPFAHKLIEAVSELQDHYYTLNEQGSLHYTHPEKDKMKWIAQSSAICGYYHYFKKIKEVMIENPNFSMKENEELALSIMQACRLKMSKTEFISCPSCGRTQYDIEKVLAMTKERFSHYPGLKLGIMGCVVNGPGEMADADYGIVGACNGMVIVYKGKEKASEIVSVEQAFVILENLINKHG